MFCSLELVSCRLAVATDCRLELQLVVTNIPKCDGQQMMLVLQKPVKVSNNGIAGMP